MNIVFFGTPTFAKDIAQGISKKHNIIATITQPDKPYGRRKILTPPPLKLWAIDNNINCYQPHKSAQIQEILHNIAKIAHIDIIIVVAYGKILQKDVVSTYTCLNLHGSILPYFRGATPVQSSIIKDYRHFGLSVILMDEGLDSGDIVASHAIQKDIVENKPIDEVFSILAPYGIDLLESILDNLESTLSNRKAQDSTIATFCTKFSKQDAYLDLLDSKECYLRYLSLHNIGVWIQSQGDIIKLNEISGYECNVKEERGKILALQGDKVLLACHNGALWLHTITMQNKPKMSARSMIQSKQLHIGDVLDIDSL